MPESEIFKVKKALSLVREMCSGLSNEDTYLKLKMIRENELQINEYLVVKVYEMIKPYMADYKTIKKENQKIEDERRHKMSKLELIMDDLETERAEFRRREAKYKKDLENLGMEMKMRENEVNVLKREAMYKENQILMLGKFDYSGPIRYYVLLEECIDFFW